MAAGVNFNNVWASLGQPVSVFGYGDHPEYGHHIGGSDASGVVWKVGPGVTNWGSFAQFTKVQAQQLLPKPKNLSWVDCSAYGLTYFTAYRMLMNRVNLQ